MTTTLDRALVRMVLIGGEPYKLVLSANGLKLTEKGHQKGVEFGWDALLAIGEASGDRSKTLAQTTDLPTGIAADVAREVRVASEALGNAKTALTKAGSIPALLLSDLEPDPIYGRAKQEDHWFVEPLLTPTEVASLLRITRPSLAHLGLKSLTVAGETRYRQSEIRRYLREHER